MTDKKNYIKRETIISIIRRSDLEQEEMSTVIYSTCVCNQTSRSACGKCGHGYCSRECQTKDWVLHKLHCQDRLKNITNLNSKFNQYSEAVYRMVGESRGDDPQWESHTIMEIGLTMNDFYTAGTSDGTGEVIMAHLHRVPVGEWEQFCSQNFNRLLPRADHKLTVVFRDASLLIEIPRRKKKNQLKLNRGDNTQTITFTV